MKENEVDDHQENKASENIFIGIACFAISMVFFNVLQFSFAITNIFFGWLLLGVAAYGILRVIVARSRDSKQANDIATGSTIILWIVGLIWWLKDLSVSPQVLGVASFFVLILVFVSGYALLARFTRERRLILVSSVLCLFSGVLWAYYQISARSIEIWSIVILFLAASILRQGLHNLISVLVPEWKDYFLLYTFPELFTLAILSFLSQFSTLEPFFHVAVAISVIALFKLANERSMQEIEASERAKIGDASSSVPIRFFSTINQFYSYINLPILGFLLFLLAFGLADKLVNSNLQSAVFQASLGTVAIVISFIVLTLQQLHQVDTLTTRQTYILRGLTGVAFMFIAIAIVAFVLLAITPQTRADLVLPDLHKDSLSKIFGSKELLFGFVLTALYEWVFLAVPLSLVVIYNLVQDFGTQFRA